MKSFTQGAIAIACLTFSLHGCVFVAGAAAGAAAIAVVYDHRTIEKTVEDTQTAHKISDKIKTNPDMYKDSHIEVTVYNQIVLLTGETPKPEWREQVEAMAKSTANVSRVYNQISVQGATSSLTRTSDSWITTKIKTEMLATQDLKSGNIKVVTENGTVYLMGMVTRSQADIAVDIARQVSGVQKVVKIFQYRD
jgi:osmotically-inducible protein OsmY